MKIEKLVNIITYCTLVVIIWCVTPPEIDSLNIFIAKIALTVILAVSYLCGDTASIPSKLLHLIGSAIGACGRAIKTSCHKVIHILGLSMDYFFSWSCEIDLRFLDALRESEEAKVVEVREPLYERIYKKYAFITAAYIALITLLDFDIFYNQSLSLFFIVTFCTAYLGLFLIGIAIYVNNAGSISVMLNAILSIIMFISACIGLLYHTPREPLGWFEPFFRVNLSPLGAFSLTPAQLTYILIVLVLLVSYSRLCATVHDLTTITIPEPEPTDGTKSDKDDED